MEHALTRALPQSVDSATADLRPPAELVAALVLGLDSGAVDFSDIPEVNDPAAYLAQVQQMLIDRGLLAGLPGEDGPLDRWRRAAACPPGCNAKGLHEFNGLSLHHDFDETWGLKPTEAGQLAGDTLHIKPAVFVPDVTLAEGADVATFEPPRALVELQDEQRTVLLLRSSEVVDFCHCLMEAADFADAQLEAVGGLAASGASLERGASVVDDGWTVPEPG